jgi:hypothetical protein
MKTLLVKFLLILVLAATASRSRDAIEIQKEIKFSNGTITPNAITCVGHPNDNPICPDGRNSTRHGATYDVPYTGMLDTPGDASVRTDIKIVTDGTERTCIATVNLWSEVAGRCTGSNDFGGAASCTYSYRTQVHLSRPSVGTTWNIRTTFTGSHQRGTVTGNAVVRIGSLPPGGGWSLDGRSHTKEYENITPGIYDVTVTFPTVEHACYSDLRGTISRAIITSSIVFEIF